MKHYVCNECEDSCHFTVDNSNPAPTGCVTGAGDPVWIKVKNSNGLKKGPHRKCKYVCRACYINCYLTTRKNTDLPEGLCQFGNMPSWEVVLNE